MNALIVKLTLLALSAWIALKMAIIKVIEYILERVLEDVVIVVINRLGNNKVSARSIQVSQKM